MVPFFWWRSGEQRIVIQSEPRHRGYGREQQRRKRVERIFGESLVGRRKLLRRRRRNGKLGSRSDSDGLGRLRSELVGLEQFELGLRQQLRRLRLRWRRRGRVVGGFAKSEMSNGECE
jgi:hypothetical protein